MVFLALTLSILVQYVYVSAFDLHKSASLSKVLGRAGVRAAKKWVGRKTWAGREKMSRCMGKKIVRVEAD